jgi:hypothetical protein
MPDQKPGADVFVSALPSRNNAAFKSGEQTIGPRLAQYAWVEIADGGRSAPFEAAVALVCRTRAPGRLLALDTFRSRRPAISSRT